VLYLMMEVCCETDYVRHHAQKALDEAAQSLGLPHAVVVSAHFLAELAGRFDTKVPRMEFFYRDMRRRLRILVDTDGAVERDLGQLMCVSSRTLPASGLAEAAASGVEAPQQAGR
jgi:hypothetical protein